MLMNAKIARLMSLSARPNVCVRAYRRGTCMSAVRNMEKPLVLSPTSVRRVYLLLCRLVPAPDCSYIYLHREAEKRTAFLSRINLLICNVI